MAEHQQQESAAADDTTPFWSAAPPTPLNLGLWARRGQVGGVVLGREIGAENGEVFTVHDWEMADGIFPHNLHRP